jgi:hypothetical protein
MPAARQSLFLIYLNRFAGLFGKESQQSVNFRYSKLLNLG